VQCNDYMLLFTVIPAAYLGALAWICLPAPRRQ
jgi:hypothetical protein